MISFKLPAGPTNIAKRIGTDWKTFGIALLDDEDGVIVQAIQQENLGHAERINLDILQKWIRGEGIRDRTWRGLLGALEKGGGTCKTLAVEMKKVLQSGNHWLITSCNALLWHFIMYCIIVVTQIEEHVCLLHKLKAMRYA